MLQHVMSLFLGPLYVLITTQKDSKGEKMEEKTQKLIFFSSQVFQTKIHPGFSMTS